MRDLARTTAILLALLAAPAFTPDVFAQEPTLISPAPIGASLPELSPDIIAADVVRTRVEGRTTLAAPDFDPFETDEGVAGRAHLRSGEGLRVAGVDADGLPLSAGAVLDIALVYAQESRDPYALRGYTSAGFLNGASVRVASYEPRLLECSTRVSEAGDYPEEYYRGDSHGPVMGVYTRFPRYRGHRDFGFGLDRRRPYWDMRYGYDYGYGPGAYRNPYVGGGYNPVYEYGREVRRDRRRNRQSDRQSDRRRERDARRRGGIGGGVAGIPGGVVADPAPRRPRTSPGGIRTGTGIGNPGGVLPDEPLGRRPVARRPVTTREDPRRTTRETIPRVEGPRTSRPARRGPRSEPRRRAPREGTPFEPRVETGSRPTPRTPSRPVIRPERASRPTPRPTPQRVDRETDRSFSRSSSSRSSSSRPSRSSQPSRTSPPSRAPSRPKARPDARPQLNWQARGQVERPAGLCAKEEQLSLFIPVERLEAARIDGLTVLVMDELGRELPVFVPPNYVEGFLRAAASSG